MSATTFSIENNRTGRGEMSHAKLWHAYLTETKYECLRALRAPAFAIPFLLLPIVLYVLFGVFLAGSMSHGDPTVAKIMFVNWSVFGVMGPGCSDSACLWRRSASRACLRSSALCPRPGGATCLRK